MRVVKIQYPQINHTKARNIIVGDKTEIETALKQTNIGFNAVMTDNDSGHLIATYDAHTGKITILEDPESVSVE